MTSSNGNIFRVTGPLWGDTTGHKGQWRGVLVFSLYRAWINGWADNPDTSDLSRHRAHYGVTVMITENFLFGIYIYEYPRAY